MAGPRIQIRLITPIHEWRSPARTRLVKTPWSDRPGLGEQWCRRRDSNPHALRLPGLSRLRLPFRHSGSVVSSASLAQGYGVMRGNVTARRTGERGPDDGCHGEADTPQADGVDMKRPVHDAGWLMACGVRVHLDWLYDAHEKSPTGDISCVDGVEATTGIEPVYAVLQTAP